jgi:hypothetical protein
MKVDLHKMLVACGVCVCMLPYLMVEVAGKGGQGLDLVVQEISAVMQVGALFKGLCKSDVLHVGRRARDKGRHICRACMNWDQPLMMALLPYLMVEVTGQGSQGLDLVVQEISAVMQVGSAENDLVVRGI